MHKPIVVVGFVDTPSGRAALDRGIEETRLRGGTLVVVHSMEGGDHTPVSEYPRYQELLDDLGERLSTEDVEHDIRQLVRGRTPADDLAETASELGAELIVIGYRRRSPAGKALLGSDAQGVLLSAPCPVLAVRPDADYPD